MTEHHLISLVGVIVLGIAAQWLAWRLHLPSILLLLVIGILAGPVTHFLRPDALLGEALVPIVSLSVAVILFEGGLSLKIRELLAVGKAVRNLVTVGAATTWAMTTVSGHYILKLSWPIALLFAAILVVTGPTVIGPLLRSVRPVTRVASILRWEGIVIDPVGALLAVLVFDAILATGPQAAAALVIGGLMKVVLIGSLVGLLGAAALIIILYYRLAPDFLHNPVALMTVVCAFAVSNFLQSESGLLSVTLMGVVLANQKFVSTMHILEFKENLRVLLIASLFILLSARLDRQGLTHIGWETVPFLVVLMLMIRPASVFLSTLGSGLSWRERIFLSWVAPRGIVAAAVSSVFSLRLGEASGHLEPGRLVPLTFLVVIVTVMVYGLTAAPVARWLGVAQPHAQGALIVGAHDWARDLAHLLKEEGFHVLLIDTNAQHIAAAEAVGLPAHEGNILSEELLDEIELAGIGKLLAVTPNDEVNSLASLHLAGVFGRSEVYQLSSQASVTQKGNLPKHLRGRILFSRDANYSFLTTRFAGGALLKSTSLTQEFGFEAFKMLYGLSAVPLFLVTETGQLRVFTLNNPPLPRPGHKLISLVDPIPSKLPQSLTGARGLEA